jgi:glycosyltransferase involved in cell wall biosynthesis
MQLVLTMGLGYFPKHGGAHKCNRRLLEELARRGHEVTAVVPSGGTSSRLQRAEQAAYLASLGVSVDSHNGVDRFTLEGVHVEAVADPAKLPRYLEEAIARVRPDRVLVSTEDPGQVLLGSALDAAPGKVVYLVHTPTALPVGPQAFFPNDDRGELVRRASTVVAVSRATADYVERWAGAETLVATFPAYAPPPYPNLGRHGEGRVTIINPCAVKGIDIFARIAATMPEVPFAAVPTWGTTKRDEERLRALPNVELWPASDDIDAIFARTQILLVPSLWHEAFGLVVVEAMLRGIPVISSDSGGLPEAKLGTEFVLPVSPIEGFGDDLDERMIPVAHVPDQDVATWVDAIAALRSDRARYQALSHEGKRRAEAFVRGIDVGDFETILDRPIPEPELRSARQPKSASTPRNGLSGLDSDRLALVVQRLCDRASRRHKTAAVTSGVQSPSFLQERLLVMRHSGRSVNLQARLELDGPIDVERLRTAFARVVERNDVLRLAFTQHHSSLIK